MERENDQMANKKNPFFNGFLKAMKFL